jgi:hypothetical protein
MACKITILLLSESQEGTIGNDWKYDLEAKIFSGPRIGKGTISVPKHTLESGQKLEPPPGPPEPLVLPAGEPGGNIQVDLRLSVAEVDVIEDDKAEMPTGIKLTCPGIGEPPVVYEREISVGVSEQPSGIGSANFKLAFRMTVENE